MKKIILNLVLISTLILCVSGCSNRIIENEVEVENFVPKGLTSEIGSGQFVITTPTGTSENNIPVIFINEFKGLAQLGFQSEGFDGSRCTYIYIDGKLNTIERLGEMNTSTLTVDEEHLSNGIHKVEVVQFDNDKTSGTPITYKMCNYEARAQ